jgi:hypothetical protein
MAAFWVVAPCSLVEVYQRFRSPSCLIIMAMRTSVTLVNIYQTTRHCNPKTTIFVPTAVRTSNPPNIPTFVIGTENIKWFWRYTSIKIYTLPVPNVKGTCKSPVEQTESLLCLRHRWNEVHVPLQMMNQSKTFAWWHVSSWDIDFNHPIFLDPTCHVLCNLFRRAKNSSSLGFMKRTTWLSSMPSAGIVRSRHWRTISTHLSIRTTLLHNMFVFHFLTATAHVPSPS